MKDQIKKLKKRCLRQVWGKRAEKVGQPVQRKVKLSPGWGAHKAELGEKKVTGKKKRPYS